MKHTRRLVLQLSLILALSAGLSCTTADIGTTGPSAGPPDEVLVPSAIIGTPDDPEIIVSLLSCTPQDYLITSQQIGPKGGRIKIGSHVLSIPERALSQQVTIVAEQITGSTNSVRFRPEGLRFARPAELTLSYNNCLESPARKKIVYTSERLDILELLKSFDKARSRTVTSPIDHFSRYAVAY
jgi:hypothetical protein